MVHDAARSKLKKTRSMLNQFADFATKTLLAQDGQECSYRYSASRTTITPTLFQSPPSTALVEKAGQVVEVMLNDFVGLESDFPYEPERGDKITCDGETFEVRPVNSEKCFKVTKGQMRIHTQQVK